MTIFFYIWRKCLPFDNEIHKKTRSLDLFQKNGVSVLCFEVIETVPMTQYLIFLNVKCNQLLPTNLLKNFQNENKEDFLL